MESTPSALCPLLSAAGVPDCSLNPALAPVFLGLAALCALAYLSFVIYDFWPPTGGIRHLLAEIMGDSLLLAVQLILIALAWLFLLVPFDRIPFIATPAPSAFLFWPAPAAYGFVAGALHIAIAVLALQFAIGLAFGQVLFDIRLVWRNMAEREDNVYTNLVAIGAIAFIWYCLEVSHWPSPAVGWLELVLGLSAASLLAQRVLAPYLRPGAGSFRVQHLVFIVTGAGVIALLWQRHAPPLMESIGVISRHDNPTLYPYMLVLIAVIFASWAIGLLLRPGHAQSNGNYVSSLGGSQNILIITLLCAYLLWLGLATPVDQLPFPSPTGIMVGGVVPLAPGYTIVAVLAHAAISIIAVIFLIANFAVGLFGLSSAGRSYFILEILAILGLIFAWEWFGWPLWLLLLSEFYLAYVVPTGIVSLARDALQKVRLRTPQALRRAQRFGSFTDYAITFVLFLVIISIHDMNSYILGVLSLYACFTLLDSLATLWHGMLQPRITNILSLTPRRWLFAIPLIAVVALIGANISTAGLPGFATLTPQIWIDAAIAGATFALFQPLMQLTNLSITSKPLLDFPRQRGLRAFLQGSEGLPEVFSQVFQLGVLAGISQARTDARGEPLSSTEPQASNVALPALPLQPGPPQSVTPTRRPGIPGPGQSANQTVTEHRDPALDRRLIFYCIGAALLYRFIASSVGLTPLFDATFLTIAAALAGLASSVTAGSNDEVGPASGLIVFVTLIVSIVASLSGLSPTTVIVNGWRLANVHTLLVEFLFCIVLLQMVFLWRTVNHTLKDRVNSLNPDDEDGWKEVAYRLSAQGRHQEAIGAYRQALDYAQERVSDDREERVDIYTALGNELYKVGQYDEALRAAESAVSLDPMNAQGLMIKGRILRALGHEEEARDAFAKATEVDPANAID